MLLMDIDHILNIDRVATETCPNHKLLQSNRVIFTTIQLQA